jgi:hypothetical protein
MEKITLKFSIVLGVIGLLLNVTDAFSMMNEDSLPETHADKPAQKRVSFNPILTKVKEFEREDVLDSEVNIDELVEKALMHDGQDEFEEAYRIIQIIFSHSDYEQLCIQEEETAKNLRDTFIMASCGLRKYLVAFEKIFQTEAYLPYPMALCLTAFGETEEALAWENLANQQQTMSERAYQLEKLKAQAWNEDIENSLAIDKFQRKYKGQESWKAVSRTRNTEAAAASRLSELPHSAQEEFLLRDMLQNTSSQAASPDQASDEENDQKDIADSMSYVAADLSALLIKK